MDKDNILAKVVEYAELSGTGDNSIIVEYNLKDKTIKQIKISTPTLDIVVNLNSDNSIDFHETNKSTDEIDDWYTNEEDSFISTLENKGEVYKSKIRSSH